MDPCPGCVPGHLCVECAGGGLGATVWPGAISPTYRFFGGPRRRPTYAFYEPPEFVTPPPTNFRVNLTTCGSMFSPSCRVREPASGLGDGGLGTVFCSEFDTLLEQLRVTIELHERHVATDTAALARAKAFYEQKTGFWSYAWVPNFFTVPGTSQCNTLLETTRAFIHDLNAELNSVGVDAGTATEVKPEKGALDQTLNIFDKAASALPWVAGAAGLIALAYVAAPLISNWRK